MFFFIGRLQLEWKSGIKTWNMKSGLDETLADPEARIATVGQAASKFTEYKNSLWIPFFFFFLAEGSILNS